MKSQVLPHPNAAKEEAELLLMDQTAMSMLDEEGRRLNEFVRASSKVETRKLDIDRAGKEAQKITGDMEQKLQAMQMEMDRQTALQKKSTDDLSRLESPPDPAAVKSYSPTRMCPRKSGRSSLQQDLPSNDPRLSSIGGFKHYLLGDLLSVRDEENYFPAFVGYVPERKVPVGNLQDMLDWDKILLKPVAPPNQV